jgi:hypothetical protein
MADNNTTTKNVVDLATEHYEAIKKVADNSRFVMSAVLSQMSTLFDIEGKLGN